MSSWGAFWSAHLQYLSAVVLLSGTMERKKTKIWWGKAPSQADVLNIPSLTSLLETQILKYPLLKHKFSGPTPDPLNQKCWGQAPKLMLLTSLPGVSMYTQVWEPLSKEKKAQWITGSVALRQSAYHCLFPYSLYSQFSEDKRGHPNNLDSSYQQNKSLYTSVSSLAR